MSGLLHELFTPLTARPFRSHAGYAELPPCEALRPYVRCFWGSRSPVPPCADAVSPDTCMDVLVRVESASGRADSLFCGINDRTVPGHPDDRPFTVFAVRFHFWAVPFFSGESMRGVCNLSAPAEAYFGSLERELLELTRGCDSLEKRARAAEAVLLKRLRQSREQPAVMNALHAVFRARGRLPVPEAAGYAAVSPRQLERLFAEYVGVTPKKLADLVRYQYLLREVLFSPRFDVQDAVLRYGYVDQAHLLKDFRRFHGMTPGAARQLAMSDFYKTDADCSGIL